MNNIVYAVITTGEQADCLGDFDKNSPLCSTYCVLRLRCVIEQSHNLRSDILEELFASEGTSVKIQ
jgi:hypothetical protein